MLSSTIGKSLDKLFLFSDQEKPQDKIPNWRISSLRIMLFCGVLICLTALLKTFQTALASNLLYIIIITVTFFSIAVALLVASHKYYTFCAHSFLLFIVSGSLVMNLFLNNIELAKLGSLFMYTCPVIAFILIGYKTAILYALLNLIPFYLMVNNINLSTFSGVQTELESSTRIINELLYLFFNICIPLAVARTSISARRLNESHLKSSYYLKEKNELYRTFFTRSNKAKVVVNKLGDIIDFNNQAAKIFKLSKISPSHNSHFKKKLDNLNKRSLNSSTPLMHYKKLVFQVVNYKINHTKYTVYEFNDRTTERNLKSNLLETEQENKRLRYFDKKTNLPNRLWFELKCTRLLKDRPDYKPSAYIVVLQNADIEYFQLKYGKANAEAITIDAYQHLITKVDEILLCAYIGKNQLAIIMNASSKNELEALLNTKIKPCLKSHHDFKGARFTNSFIFGCDSFSQHTQSITDVLNNAINALKQSDKNLRINFYNQLNSKRFVEKHEISILLDEAIKLNELEVYYQPKVSVSGKCIGLEALARWNSPTIGFVSPATFIPIAEEYGMINRLTDLVIKSVCTQLSIWQKNEIETVPVAINISFISFNEPKFMPTLLKHLSDFNINPKQIELELTETALDQNYESSIKLMKVLQSWGFNISIDDFGVGYSNISRIAEFPIDKLKIDKSLINKITTSSRQVKLAKVILFMCKELNIKCVAEGVETLEQVKIMANLGCHEFQGFYFSKPLSVEQYAQHISQFGLNFNKSTELKKQVRP